MASRIQVLGASASTQSPASTCPEDTSPQTPVPGPNEPASRRSYHRRTRGRSRRRSARSCFRGDASASANTTHTAGLDDDRVYTLAPQLRLANHEDQQSTQCLQGSAAASNIHSAARCARISRSPRNASFKKTLFPVCSPWGVFRGLRQRQKVLFSRCFVVSGRQDLNLRPPGPQPGALPDCATPRGPSPTSGRRESNPP
jgi:hypothetical protein